MIKTTSKYLTNYFSIKKYNDNYYKLVFHKTPLISPGFDLRESYQGNRSVNEDKLSNNLIRAKNKVFEYAACNDFDYFVTLTLDPKKYNRHDLPGYIKDLGQFIRNYRRNHNLDIQYLLIPEEHKDGAWHMHGLIKGISLDKLYKFTLKDKLPYKILDMIKEGRTIYDWPDYSNRFGWVTLESVICRVAVSKYITKYITKCVDLGKGVTDKNKKLYYSSRGLKVSEKIKEGSLTVGELDKITFDFENDYVCIKELTGIEYLRLINSLGI